MKVRAIIGAAAAAVLGAVVWAVITSATGYEVGIVAWGIGLAVGIGAKAFGGEGQVLGVVCAALALGSIFVGKVVAVQHVTEGQISGLMEAALDESFYEEVRQDAQHFAELESDEDYAEFMVERGFSEAEAPGDVTEEGIADFTEHQVPRLRRFQEEQPGYDR